MIYRILLKMAAITALGYMAHALHRPLQPLSEGVKHLTKSGIGILAGLPGVALLADEVPVNDIRARSVLITLLAYCALGLGVFGGWVGDAIKPEEGDK